MCVDFLYLNFSLPALNYPHSLEGNKGFVLFFVLLSVYRLCMGNTGQKMKTRRKYSNA